MNFLYPIRFMVITALAFVVFTAPGYAVEADGDIKPLIPVEDISNEEFEARTQIFEDIPLNDPYLSYRLRLPNDWTASKTQEAERDEDVSDLRLDILGSIGSYIGPPSLTSRSYLAIEALGLKSRTTARGWFLDHALNQGYAVEGMDEISDNEIEAAYFHVVQADDVTYIVRLRAFINGPRIIVVRYFVPLERYEEEKTMQVKAIKGFQLLNMEGRQFESQSTYRFLDQSYFNFPNSWQLQTQPIRTVERMKAELMHYSNNREFEGRIQVHAISKLLGTSLADEVRLFMQNFNVEDYNLQNVIESLDLKVSDQISFAKTEVYRLRSYDPKKMEYELWATVMEGEEYYYITTLITPSRHFEYVVWNKNAEAYKVVVRSVRRTE